MSNPLCRRYLVMVAVALSASACGSKTGLSLDPMDAAVVRRDAGRDAGRDSGPPPRDGGFDAALDAPMCTPGVISLRQSTIEIIFVIDRSGSMEAAFDGSVPGPGESRWEILEVELGDALTVFDSSVSVGAKFFPTRSARPVEDPCAVFDGLDVPLGPGRVPGIIAQFARWNPAGGTPVGPAMRQALSALEPTSGPMSAQFIVLATDGQPSCTGTAIDEAFTALGEARVDLGIDTYVLGIASSPLEVAVLDQMAILGGRPRPAGEDTRFYDARDPVLLASLLNEIARDLTQCVFVVPVPPDDDDVIEVSVDGLVVPRDLRREEGWDFTNERREQLSFFGTACARVIDRGSVRADITCN